MKSSQSHLNNKTHSFSTSNFPCFRYVYYSRIFNIILKKHIFLFYHFEYFLPAFFFFAIILEFLQEILFHLVANVDVILTNTHEPFQCKFIECGKEKFQLLSIQHIIKTPMQYKKSMLNLSGSSLDRPLNFKRVG